MTYSLQNDHRPPSRSDTRLAAMRARFSPGSAVELLVADHQRLVRDGVVLHLAACAETLTIAEADDYHDLFGILEAGGRFDLIVCELAMPGPPWRLALKRVRTLAPTTPILALSAGENPVDMAEALQSGATSFLPKTADGLTFLHAVQVTLSGLQYLPPRLHPCQPAPSGGPDDAWPGQLTRRQRQILDLMALGMSNKEIARSLGLAEGTVKIHVTSVIRTLGARNRVQAVMAAREQGII